MHSNKRAPKVNAFMIFTQAFMADYELKHRRHYPGRFEDAMKDPELAAKWEVLSMEEKEAWKEKARTQKSRVREDYVRRLFPSSNDRGACSTPENPDRGSVSAAEQYFGSSNEEKAIAKEEKPLHGHSTDSQMEMDRVSSRAESTGTKRAFQGGAVRWLQARAIQQSKGNTLDAEFTAVNQQKPLENQSTDQDIDSFPIASTGSTAEWNIAQSIVTSMGSTADQGFQQSGVGSISSEDYGGVQQPTGDWIDSTAVHDIEQLTVGNIYDEFNADQQTQENVVSEGSATNQDMQSSTIGSVADHESQLSIFGNPNSVILSLPAQDVIETDMEPRSAVSPVLNAPIVWPRDFKEVYDAQRSMPPGCRGMGRGLHLLPEMQLLNAKMHAYFNH